MSCGVTSRGTRLVSTVWRYTGHPGSTFVAAIVARGLCALRRHSRDFCLDLLGPLDTLLTISTSHALRLVGPFCGLIWMTLVIACRVCRVLQQFLWICHRLHVGRVVARSASCARAGHCHWSASRTVSPVLLSLDCPVCTPPSDMLGSALAVVVVVSSSDVTAQLVCLSMRLACVRRPSSTFSHSRLCRLLVSRVAGPVSCTMHSLASSTLHTLRVGL